MPFLPASLKPLLLGPNQPERFYRGGAVIARFRGSPQPSAFAPEDFVGSTTEVFGGDGVGLTRLADGTTLRDAVIADPLGYLGPDHVARFGADPALLVKLLDAGERLLVHFHPDATFALRHLDCRHGKTEAWVVIDVERDVDDDSSGYLYLGFTDDVDSRVVRQWVDDQDTAAILGSLHRFRVEPGDTCLVPAGIPHAIGSGITLVEVQEPSDLSILLEWAGYAIDGPADGHLGLGLDTALEALDRRRLTPERLAQLRGRRGDTTRADGVTRLLPPEADTYFRVEEIDIDGSVSLDANFAILIVLSGQGILHAAATSTARNSDTTTTSTTGNSNGTNTAGNSIELSRGATVLVPYGAGPIRLDGHVTALRCLPPGAPS